MKRALLISFLILLPLPAAAVERGFHGDLGFMPAGCSQTGDCELTSEFSYVDTKDVSWLASAHDHTDGASIPKWAQKITGGAFDKQFIKAAVIHDHYCNRYVRPWRQTHWMFYDALLATGVPKAKAKLMYYAVYLFGPHWANAMEGQECHIGNDCINVMVGGSIPSGSSIVTEDDKKRYLVKPASFDDSRLQDELDYAQTLIDKSNGDISLDDLEARAKASGIEDYYFDVGDTVSIQNVLPDR